MKILHRYILRNTLFNLTLSLFVFTMLFLVVDFIDRIDNLFSDGASFSLIVQYFLLKTPQMLTQVIPIAMLTATLFTIGLLSKNSELTAMRASGATVLWLIRPVLLVGLGMSFLTLIFSQTVVPYSVRRVKEIYNIDIRKKDQSGSYSRTNFWWREGKKFYSASMFDSRTDTLSNTIKLTLTADMKVQERLDASEIRFLTPELGWNITEGTQRIFNSKKSFPKEIKHTGLPIMLHRVPKDFYDILPEPDTMSFFELQRFMFEQAKNGLSTSQYLAHLYEKISFPFVTLVVTFVVVTFAMLPARSGSMALPIMVSIGISFTYYALHSFSIALGRAELIDPLLAAWFSNLVYGVIGGVLLLGAEST
jgi:lipopolysaccharide export system permease protein